jgi:hypothetical protein
MFWHKNSASYDSWMERMLQAENELLRDHLFLGVSTWTGEPILLAKDLLNEHVWVTGGSGSGKSALILGPLGSQVIRRRNMSVVWIDQKDDAPSFWNAFDCAYQAGLPFKYFSMVPGDESYLYSPLRQEVHRRFTPMQRAELLSQAAGLDLGEIYGANFFQGKSELLLCNYLTHYADPPLEDFQDLFRLFNDKFSYADIGHVDDWADASHLRSVFARLASVSSLYGSLKTLPKPKAHAQAMDVFELLRRPTVFYFKLPASAGRSTARFIARSVLQNLFAAAGLRRSDESVPVLVVCDEFAELVGPSLDVLLEQSRSRALFYVLAHQSIHQLERNGVNLLPVVQACTSTHIVVEASDAESVEYVRKRSGKAYFALTSWSQEAPSAATDSYFENDYFRPWKAATSDPSGTPLMNVREEIDYRLDENTVHRVSADVTGAFVAVKKNSGFSKLNGFLIPVRCFFHIPHDLFTARAKEPWPTWDRPETVIVRTASPFAGAGHGPNGRPEPIRIVPPPQGATASLLGRLRQRGPQNGKNNGTS